MSTALVTILFLGHFIYKRQTELIYKEKISSVTATLNNFVNSARLPLLADDVLALNTVIKSADGEDGPLYVVIADRAQTIKAHTDPAEIGKKNIYPEDAVISSGPRDGVSRLEYMRPDGLRVLDFASPITFKGKKLGAVHLGFPGDKLRDSARAAASRLFKSMLPPVLGLALIFAAAALLAASAVRRQLRRLNSAVKTLGMGGRELVCKELPNNEFGDMVFEFCKVVDNLRTEQPARIGFHQHLKCSTLDRIFTTPMNSSPPNAVRRQVTILFVGIKGFRDYAGPRKPAEIVEALNEYIKITTSTISAFGGYVDKFIGDAVIGIFGVSLYREDHTERAVKAAVAIQDALHRDNKIGGDLFCRAGIGISSGIVLSGNIGSHAKMEYGSIGESIEEAYWLHGLAKPGEIIISKDIEQLSREIATSRPLPPHAIPGRSEDLLGFQLEKL